MESIGEKFRSARQEKGYSLEHVARETHIAKRYINAIETEAFDEFPAEPYILGFLRSYAEYLDLDPEETVGLYRNLKLQEQPPPMEQLITPKKHLPVSTLIIVLLVCVLVGGVVFLFTQGYFVRASRIAPVENVTGPEMYRFTEEFLEQRFSQGDQIRMELRNREYTVVVSEISSTVVIETPAGAWELDRTRENMVDVTNDGREDLKILVRDLALNGGSPSVVLRFDRVIASPGRIGLNGNDQRDPDGLPIGSSTVAARVREAETITELVDISSFSVMVEFTAPVLFRFLIDGHERGEQYFQSGQSFSVDAERTVRIWSSNAGATRLQVAGTPVTLGMNGENSAALIRYRENDGGISNELELVPVY